MPAFFSFQEHTGHCGPWVDTGKALYPCTLVRVGFFEQYFLLASRFIDDCHSLEILFDATAVASLAGWSRRSLPEDGAGMSGRRTLLYAA